MSSTEVDQAVRAAVAEALGITPEEATPESSLIDDLGAESIDLLDMLFRIERRVGIKIKAADLANYVQGGIPDGQFGTAEGVVSEAGLSHLAKIMPQIDVDGLRGKLPAEKVINLFTVQNLADMVVERGAALAR